MSEETPPIAAAPDRSSSEERQKPEISYSARKSRFPHSCTARSADRLRPESPPSPERRRERDDRAPPACRIVTSLVPPPSSPSQIPRWTLRSMWELASLLNFLHVFRPLLNIKIELTAEELETALITPNSALDDIHMPLLKAIPPVTRMALSRATWVTVLCRKLKDWWHWVSDGEVPIVASHGTEVEAYKALEPVTRVLILKALCDIRVEQEDIRSYIENSLKHGVQLSAFRRERIGGASYGVSYWYEDDPIIGHRLYREIRHAEVNKPRTKGSQALPPESYRWETVATNLDEFQEVSDKLFPSKNRTEASLGKRLKIDILPEIEKIHKRKERVLKKQHRQALLLDSFIIPDGLSSGRSLRDRKPVTYTFDDYDRSISEALKITMKRQTSPENVRKEIIPKPEASINGRRNGKFDAQQLSFDNTQSPKSSEHEETDEQLPGSVDRSRRRKRPQRYSQKEFVEAVSDNEADFDSDDDIVGEAVYDEEYLRSRKQQKATSSSKGDEEYRCEDNLEEDDEEEEDESLSGSEDSEEHHHHKKYQSRSRRGTKLRSVDELQSNLRRSKRSTRPRIDYRQYEISDTESDSGKANKSNASNGISGASKDTDFSGESEGSHDEEDREVVRDEKVNGDYVETVGREHFQTIEKTSSPIREVEGTRRERFLDLNELAPGTGYEYELSTVKDEDGGKL